MKASNHYPDRPPGLGQSEPLKLLYRRIDELKPDPANPRRHSKKQIRQIARSIEAFGFNVPVLIDREDNVVAGHGRLLACAELGWTEVPTLGLDHLSPAQARAFRIAVSGRSFDDLAAEVGAADV